MKEWAEARERVFDLKATDPKGAEALNSEITNRYQAEYFSVQTDSDRRTLQLDATHQQHVQSNLNVKKRAAMQKLMEELQSEFYDVSSEPSTWLKWLAKPVADWLILYLTHESRSPQVIT